MLLRPLTQREVQFVTVKFRLLCNENRVAHGVGQGVAGDGLKKGAPRAGLGGPTATTIPITFQIAAHDNR